MLNRTIVAGVDASAEGGWAGFVGRQLAAVHGVKCRLVHVTSDVTAGLVMPPGIDYKDFNARATEAARAEVEERLRGDLPEDAVADLELFIGKPELVLKEVAHESDADLIVLGGKHHTAVERWFGGSTAQHLLRIADVPVLVTVPPAKEYRRVLVAVDLSDQTMATLQAAIEFAHAFGGELRAVHVVEPLPWDYTGMIQQPEAYVEWSREQLEAKLREVMGDSACDHVVRYGPAARTLVEEAVEWHADLVVLGSHGKGLVDRLLLGSTTRNILRHLPTSLLIIPPGYTPRGVPTRAKGERKESLV